MLSSPLRRKYTDIDVQASLAILNAVLVLDRFSFVLQASLCAVVPSCVCLPLVYHLWYLGAFVLGRSGVLMRVSNLSFFPPLLFPF